MADQKKLFFKGGKGGGNLEHQASGLLWNIETGFTPPSKHTRYRFTGGKVVTEQLGSHQMGQWGLAIDDTGRIFCNTAGGENPGWGFQVSPVYQDIRLKGELADGFVCSLSVAEDDRCARRPRPPMARRRNESLHRDCAGGSIYRGDALPADIQGDYILPEPVGRLIRRAKVGQ